MWISCSMLFVYFCFSGVASAEDQAHIIDSGIPDGKRGLTVNISNETAPKTQPHTEQQLSVTVSNSTRNMPKTVTPLQETHLALGVKEDAVPIEGGSVSPPVTSKLDQLSKLLDVEESGLQTQNKSRKVFPRKGAPSKIVARKGVNDGGPVPQETDSYELSGVRDITTPIREKKIPYSLDSASSAASGLTSSLASTTAKTVQEQPTSGDRNEKNVLVTVGSANNSTTTTTKPSPQLSESSEKPTSVSPLPHKKKSKPDLTFDKDDLPRDEADEVDSGPATDYVVPVVLSMMAAPLLAIAGAFIYKKGRDFWERRHYRRMDFLIDGMYND